MTVLRDLAKSLGSKIKLVSLAYVAFDLLIHQHCVKSGRIRNFSYSVRMRENTDQKKSEYGHLRDTEYLSVFRPNVRKYGPEKLRIRTLFTQCKSQRRIQNFVNHRSCLTWF